MPESEGPGSAAIDEAYDDDEYDEDGYPQQCEIPAEVSAAPRRVDKSHGFMRLIIKNQVDRDNYDKAVKATKAAQAPKRQTPFSNRPKRPERATYQPPSGRRALFVLEYSDQNQRQWKHTVRDGDTPQQVLEQIERQRGELGPPNIREAFIKFITGEFRKRDIPVCSQNEPPATSSSSVGSASAS